MKKILLFFLIVGISLTAAFLTTNYEDISQSIGLPAGNVFAQGIEAQSRGEDGTRITFIEKDASICFIGRCINNVKPENSNTLSYVDVNLKGDVVQADFKSNEQGGTYIFSGTEISSPPDSRVIFDYDTGINQKIPDAETLLELPKFSSEPDSKNHLTIVEGNRIKLPGNFFMSGKLNFLENRIFLSLSDGTSINDVLTLNKFSRISTNLKESDVYLDGKEHGITSLSFGEEDLVLESVSENGPIVKFGDENPYIEVEKDGNVAMQPSEGKIKITNRESEEKIPEVKIEGESLIINGDRVIKVEKGRVYLTSENNKSLQSSPVEIVVESKDGRSLMREHRIFVDNSKKIAVVSEKESGSVSSSGGDDEKAVAKVAHNYESKEGFLERLFKKAAKLFREDRNWVEREAVIGVKG